MFLQCHYQHNSMRTCTIVIHSHFLYMIEFAHITYAIQSKPSLELFEVLPICIFKRFQAIIVTRLYVLTS